MTSHILSVITLVVLVAVIYRLGGRGFGRAQSQGWIDRMRHHPRLHGWLERNHSALRASAHYIEFGGLFLVLYWVWDGLWGPGGFHAHALPMVMIAPLCALAAHLDELHQLRSGGRQYRREDFLHSCKGIALAAGIVVLQDVVRRLL